MRELSSTLVIAAVCVLGIASAPTPAPSGQTHMSSQMEVMRLPQHQTACIVDVIQNNTDPDTHIVSREVEVLLTQCFVFPAQRCPEENPDCMMPPHLKNHAKEPMETTEESARDDEPTTVAPSGRAADEVQHADTLAPEQAKRRQQQPTTEKPSRADEVPTTAAPSGRSDAELQLADTLAPEQAKRRQQQPTTEKPSRTDEIPTTSAPSGRADESPTTVASSGRADEKADTLAPEQAKRRQQQATTEKPSRADEGPTTVASSGRDDATPPATVPSSTDETTSPRPGRPDDQAENSRPTTESTKPSRPRRSQHHSTEAPTTELPMTTEA